MYSRFYRVHWSLEFTSFLNTILSKLWFPSFTLMKNSWKSDAWVSDSYFFSISSSLLLSSWPFSVGVVGVLPFKKVTFRNKSRLIPWPCRSNFLVSSMYEFSAFYFIILLISFVVLSIDSVSFMSISFFYFATYNIPLLLFNEPYSSIKNEVSFLSSSLFSFFSPIFWLFFFK